MTLTNLKYILVVGLLLMSMKNFAQSSLRISDTIPYEILEDKLILSLQIGEKPAKFILDTGGVNLITSDSVEHHGVTVLRRETVMDVNSKSSIFYKGSISNLHLSKNIVLPSAEILITPPQAYFRSLGVVGALGGEAFANVCLTFHPREKYIVITYPYRPARISRKEGIAMNMGNKFHSIFPLKIGDVTIETLFDTGMSDFFHLPENQFSEIRKYIDSSTIVEGNGIWHVGVGGVKGVEPEKNKKFTLPSMTIMNTTFENVGVLTNQGQHAMIGRQLLEYGKVILDYPRGLFYFYPYEDINTSDMSFKIWNVNILPIVDHFEVTAIMGDLDIEIGERVWDINGTSLESFPLDQGKINKLLADIETSTAYILVGETKAVARKVIITKI